MAGLSGSTWEFNSLVSSLPTINDSSAYNTPLSWILGNLLYMSSALLSLTPSSYTSSTNGISKFFLRFCGTSKLPKSTGNADNDTNTFRLILALRTKRDLQQIEMKSMQESFVGHIQSARDQGILAYQSNTLSYCYRNLEVGLIPEESAHITCNDVAEKDNCLIFPELYFAYHQLVLVHIWLVIILGEYHCAQFLGENAQIICPALICPTVNIILTSSTNANPFVKLQLKGSSDNQITGDALRVLELCPDILVDISLAFTHKSNIKEYWAAFFRQYVKDCLSSLPLLLTSGLQIYTDNFPNSNIVSEVNFMSLTLPNLEDNREAFVAWINGCLRTVLNPQKLPITYSYAGPAGQRSEAAPITPPQGGPSAAAPIQPLPPTQPPQNKKDDLMSIARILNQDTT